MEELKVLNCSGSSQEEVGQLMSNLAHTPFWFDGWSFASVEAFYICLRTLDEAQRLELTQLHGREAKNKGTKLKKKLKLTHTSWQGREFELGSPEHHELVKRAIRAKLEQNPVLLTAFLATAPRPIIHDTGWPESKFTQLPGEKFCAILTALRLELAQAAGI